jgi:DNA-binding NtrC family response regulator
MNYFMTQNNDLKSHLSSTRYKILVADDTDSIRQTLTMTLQLEGYDVFEACDSNAAIEVLKVNRIDLIVSDIDMPGGNGLQLLEPPPSPELTMPPVILISGSCLFSREKLRSLGAIEFFRKPVQIDDFLFFIRKTLA